MSTASNSDNRPADAAKANPKYVSEVGEDDVLLGRGAPIINNEGNVRFRKLVQTRKATYVSSGRHQIKNEIAKQIIDIVEQRGGKFLRRLEDERERGKLGIPSHLSDVWVVADEATVAQKVKQALREQDSKSQGLLGNVGPSESTSSAPRHVSAPNSTQLGASQILLNHNPGDSLNYYSAHNCNSSDQLPNLSGFNAGTVEQLAESVRNQRFLANVREQQQRPQLPQHASTQSHLFHHLLRQREISTLPPGILSIANQNMQPQLFRSLLDQFDLSHTRRANLQMPGFDPREVQHRLRLQMESAIHQRNHGSNAMMQQFSQSNQVGLDRLRHMLDIPPSQLLSSFRQPQNEQLNGYSQASSGLPTLASATTQNSVPGRIERNHLFASLGTNADETKDHHAEALHEATVEETKARGSPAQSQQSDSNTQRCKRKNNEDSRQTSKKQSKDRQSFQGVP